MLWVDKHRPKELSKLDYHGELSSRLQMLVSVYTRSHSIRDMCIRRSSWCSCCMAAR